VANESVGIAGVELSEEVVVGLNWEAVDKRHRRSDEELRREELRARDDLRLKSDK
jgi:hypothetical protein